MSDSNSHHVTLEDLRDLLVQNCMLSGAPETIQEDTPLFGEGSINLDSIDALQMIVAIEKRYGVSISSPELARTVLQTLGSLREWLMQKLSEKSL